MPQEAIKICISYHQRLIADGISSILARNKKAVVCKVFLNNPAELRKELSAHNPDILLMEAEYIGPHFIELLESTRKAFPHLKILIISGLISHEVLNELLLTIDGYVLRTCEAEKLIFAIHQVIESGKFLCSQLINILVDKKGIVSQLKQELTAREKEILLLWFTISSIMQIAEKLHISKTTVRTHLKNIRDKLGRPSSAKMIFYACQENQANGNLNPVCPYCKSVCTAIPQNHVNDLT